MQFSRENSLVEVSGSPRAWEKVLTPDSLYHPHGGFPGDAQDPVRLEGQEAAGVLREGVSLRWASRAQGSPGVVEPEAKQSCACLCFIQRQLVICLI